MCNGAQARVVTCSTTDITDEMSAVPEETVWKSCMDLFILVTIPTRCSTFLNCVKSKNETCSGPRVVSRGHDRSIDVYCVKDKIFLRISLSGGRGFCKPNLLR